MCLNKFHLLCSLLVSSRANTSTKDNLKFPSQHSSTGSLTKGKTLPTIGRHTSREGVCVVDVGLL